MAGRRSIRVSTGAGFAGGGRMRARGGHRRARSRSPAWPAPRRAVWPIGNIPLYCWTVASIS